MKQVGVIILNWNGAELLRRYLPTVIAGTDAAIADVIVADNGSTDNSLKVLQEEFPEVKMLKFDKNYGFCTLTRCYSTAMCVRRRDGSTRCRTIWRRIPKWVL